MSTDLQNRNVRLVTTRHANQPRSERLIPVARSDRAGEGHPFRFSFETIRSTRHSAACRDDNAFSGRAITAGSLRSPFAGPAHERV